MSKPVNFKESEWREIFTGVWCRLDDPQTLCFECVEEVKEVEVECVEEAKVEDVSLSLPGD